MKGLSMSVRTKILLLIFVAHLSFVWALIFGIVVPKHAAEAGMLASVSAFISAFGSVLSYAVDKDWMK